MAFHKKEEFSNKEQSLASFAKAVSHPARIAILGVLAKKNECICGEIVEILPLDRNAGAYAGVHEQIAIVHVAHDQTAQKIEMLGGKAGRRLGATCAAWNLVALERRGAAVGEVGVTVATVVAEIVEEHVLVVATQEDGRGSLVAQAQRRSTSGRTPLPRST